MKRKTAIEGYNEDGIPIILCSEKHVRVTKWRERSDWRKYKDNPFRTEWRFWCEFCGRYHVHGPKPGHRNPHCHNPNSPFAEKGYILKFGGILTAKTNAD